MTSLAASGLAAVFLANRDRLLGFLRAHGAGDATEDLLQELWVRVSAAPQQPIAQPLAYLYRAANNLMLDRYRSLRQAAQRDQDWAEVAGGDIRGGSDAPLPDRAIIARQQLAQAQAALDAVGPRAAAAYRRYRLDGISQRDIAAELGVSLSTVESDLRRAWQALIALQRNADKV